MISRSGSISNIRTGSGGTVLRASDKPVSLRNLHRAGSSSKAQSGQVSTKSTPKVSTMPSSVRAKSGIGVPKPPISKKAVGEGGKSCAKKKDQQKHHLSKDSILSGHFLDRPTSAMLIDELN